MNTGLLLLRLAVLAGCCELARAGSAIARAAVLAFTGPGRWSLDHAAGLTTFCGPPGAPAAQD